MSRGLNQRVSEKESCEEKEKMNWKYIELGAFIVCAMLLCFGVIMVAQNVKESFEATAKLQCAYHYIGNSDVAMDFYHVCSDDECRSHFMQKATANLKSAKVCLK